MGGIAILKIYFYACPPLADLRSPSGHTALSFLVYGALSLVVAVESRGWRRYLTLVLGGGFIAAIAVSRIVVRAHSMIEVIAGSAIGLVALAIFALTYRRNRPADVSLRPLVISSILLMFLLNGQELRAEEFLHGIAVLLNVSGRACA
jgi:membrane-associated phospholipid phosphatase